MPINMEIPSERKKHSINMNKTKILSQTDKQIEIDNKIIKDVYEYVYLSYLVTLEKKNSKQK